MVGRITGAPPRLAEHSKFATGDGAIRGLLGNVITRLLSHGA
jgi:hypothetical protein